MAQHESDELLAEWQSDLEAVLYAPEVEEAIQEASLYVALSVNRNS